VSRRFRRSCGADAVGLGRRLPANRSILSNLDADEDSGATAVAIVAPDAVSRVWSPTLDEFFASSCRLERIRRTWFAGSGAAKVASPGEDTPKAPRAFADPLRLPALAYGDDAPHNLRVLSRIRGLKGRFSPRGSAPNPEV